MKIIVIHGDDIPKLHKRLQYFMTVAKSKDFEVKRVSDTNTNILEAIVSESLFNQKKMILIDDYKILDKKLLDFFKKRGDSLDLTLILFSESIIPQNYLKMLPKIDREEKHVLPKLIWSFLDSFYPGNSRMVAQLLYKLVKREPVEFIFSLLAKRLRDIYLVRSNSQNLTYPYWQLNKLKKQSLKFTQPELEELVKEMAEIDLRAKTSSEDLFNSLDLMILTRLK